MLSLRVRRTLTKLCSSNVTATTPRTVLSQAIPAVRSHLGVAKYVWLMKVRHQQHLKQIIRAGFSLEIVAVVEVPTKAKKSNGDGGVLTETGLVGWKSLGTDLHVWRLRCDGRCAGEPGE